MYTRKNGLNRIAYLFCLLGFGLAIQGCPSSFPFKSTNGEEIETPISEEKDSDPKVAPSIPTQHAMVVGINNYKHLPNLRGAVNDAEMLRDALHHINVQLPEERVLLNEQATRDAFIRGWNDMLEEAKSGDTLILTFAGHGGQKPDGNPLDEEDEMDELLTFHDFHSENPPKGYIIDDELYGLFKEAKAYHIVFLVDACHSSGMVRNPVQQLAGQYRSSGFWDIQPDIPPPEPILPTQSDNQPLAHVTLITAVHADSLKVSETILNNKLHGALSWYFAQALSGKADKNQNGRLESDELNQFLQEKVSDKMDNLQMPKMWYSEQQSIITLSSGTVFEPPSRMPNISDIAIVVENAANIPDLKYVQRVDASKAVLRFVVKHHTEVFNNLGEQISTLPTDAFHLWQRVIDKERLLNSLAEQFDMRLQPVSIILREGDKLHKQGEELHFKIAPGNTQEGLNALTLFNLASDGELQVLYPWPNSDEPLEIETFPYTIPPLEVQLPFGKDNLVVLLCSKPTEGLHDLLADSQPNIPEPEKILEQLHKDDNRCQVGQYAFFSSK